jgi:hypothetical protein
MRRRAFLRGVGAAGGAALAAPFARSAGAVGSAILERLRRERIAVVAGVAPVEAAGIELADLEIASGLQARRSADAGNVTLRAAAVAGIHDALDLAVTFRAKGDTRGAAVSLALKLGAWSRDNYVLLPGACYAGNRFESRFVGYPPLLTEPADIGPHVPPIISDIPRLNLHAGRSRLEIGAADLATPAVAVFVPAAQLGLVLLVDPTTPAGPTGLTVFESDDRARAGIGVSAPFTLDPDRQVGHLDDPSNRGLPRAARAAPLKHSPASRDREPLALRARIFVFDCGSVGQLCERLFEVRKSLSGPTFRAHTFPFSAAFAAHEERVNRRWVEKPGYFAAGSRDCAYSTWQTGWCGGLAGTLPLLSAGDAPSRARALKTIAFALEGGQARSGFFHGLSDGKTWYDDGFTAALLPAAGPWPVRAPPYAHARRWHLVRRSADTLTFLIKQLTLLDRRAAAGPSATPVDSGSAAWAKAARRCADALADLWRRNHQLGQFVDVETGELLVGGSTSAAIAPAALALSADYFKEPRYLQIAKAIAEQQVERYLQLGITCGGPGDALQCPDGESAAALLESLVTLYEATQEKIWIDRARAAAHLLATWVISYDLESPASASSPPARLRTTGAVLSDAQSRTGMPGYVLLSGDALFRLYRATGEIAFLELLRDTVHNLGQYLARVETPPAAAGASVVSRAALDGPRVDTSRWLEAKNGVVPVGSLYDAIGLLAYTEVPGIYAQPEAGLVFPFDHVDARLKERLAGHLIVALHNPTPHEAKVRLYSESAAEAAHPLRPGAILEAPVAVVPPGATIEVAMPPMAAGR